MSNTLELRCRCGKVQGHLTDASPQSVNRIVCYCDDCQAYLHHLGRADLLDAHGGTDIVQVAPASLTFELGKEHIVGLRLSPKGLYRWYADCCKTPIGNHSPPAIPYIGIVAQAFANNPGGPDAILGKPLGGILGKFAVGTPPPGSTGVNVPLLGRTIRKVLGWKLGGKTWPHPFIDRSTREPYYRLTVLAPEERERLRSP